MPRPLLRAALAATLSVLGIAGCARPATTSSTAEVTAPVPVRVALLRFAPVSVPLEVSGSLEPVRSVIVGAASAGRIVAMNVRAGDAVRTGDAMAQVDVRAYVAGLAQARAGATAADASASATRSAVDAAADATAGARAELAAANARAALAETTAARMTDLFAQGAISKQQHDETLVALEAARAAAVQARAGLDAAASDLAAARARVRAAAATSAQAGAAIAAAGVPLGDATVTAPFGGIVVATFVEPGAVVGIGSPIATVQDGSTLEADVAVPDDAAARLSPGAPVDVRVDAAGGAILHARIRAIVPSQDAALRSATVKIDVPSAPGLQSGMYVRVAFVRRTAPVWVAPLAALVTRAGQSGLFVIRDGTAAFVPVRTGAAGAADVELLGYTGPAVSVAVSGVQRVDDGSRVTVVR